MRIPACPSPHPLQEAFNVGGEPIQLEVGPSSEGSPLFRGEPVVERWQHAPWPALLQTQLLHVDTPVLDDEVAAWLHERREVSQRRPRGFVHVGRILAAEDRRARWHDVLYLPCGGRIAHVAGYQLDRRAPVGIR